MTGCGEEPQQHLYKSRQDCLEDWGREQDCREAGYGTYISGVGYRPYFLGPQFRTGSLSSGRGSRAISTTGVSRGGFGSSSRFHSSFGG